MATSRPSRRPVAKSWFASETEMTGIPRTDKGNGLADAGVAVPEAEGAGEARATVGDGGGVICDADEEVGLGVAAQASSTGASRETASLLIDRIGLEDDTPSAPVPTNEPLTGKTSFGVGPTWRCLRK